jgi:ATP-binding protein involved in chromosome partitioning
MTPKDVATDDLKAAIDARAAELSAGRTSAVRVQDGRISLTLDVGELPAEARDAFADMVREGLAELAGGMDIRIAMIATKRQRTLIAVASGKGGVGKSTVATNLALALSALGRRVGMVDADIYGPSQPRLLGSEGEQPDAYADKLLPIMTPHGIPLLSMGQIAAPGQAIAWRGPMAGKALDQLVDAHWGDTDLLILDLPPGTGDIQISMLQKYKPAGAVIVSTPQDIALIDAARAITLFREADVPIIGMVENMAGYACPHCLEISDPFGSGGAESEAATLDMPFLGRVPLDRSIRLASDAGVPPVAQGGDIAAPFIAIAAEVDRWLSARTGATFGG